MKSTLKLLLLSLTAALILTSCEKDENSPKKIIVKMGAQLNTTIGAFYSIGQNKVCTQDLAYTKQDTIDLLCFYEHDELNNRINDITISSPGANITGIFTGETSPDVWTVKRLTTFTLPATEIDTVTFDQLKQDDEVIESYYNSTITSGNKKAKLLQKNDIYAFLTHDSIYGLFRVLDVALGVDGYVEVELKLKK